MHLATAVKVTAMGLACSGCLHRNDLVWQVDRADQVTLEYAYVDGGKRFDVLPAGSSPTSVVTRYRAGTAVARRNADGSIDLLFGDDGVWNLVRADGYVTMLRDDAYALPPSGPAWGFLSYPPNLDKIRTPWTLRLATPHENLLDARVLVRRNAAMGWLLLVGGAAFACAGGAFAVFRGTSRSDSGPSGAVMGIPFFAAGAGMGTAGLYELLRPEYDEVLVKREPAGR
jgi:hypothetical protein